MILIDLIYNLAVLVALSVLSGFIDFRFDRNQIRGQIFQGMLFGITAIIGMLYPFILTEGIIFDGRSIVISLCTLFFGPVSGAISSIIAILFRAYLGGSGTLTGVLVIISSFLIGYFFYFRRNKNQEKRTTKMYLYVFGFIVNAAMLLLFLTLAYSNKLEMYKILTPTILGIYPFATLLIGKILLDQEENKSYVKKIEESEERWQYALEGPGDGVWDWNTKTNKVYFSHKWKFILGYNDDEIRDNLHEWEKLVHPDDKKYVFQELNKHFNNETPVYKSEHRLLCKDGNYKWVLDRGKVISRDKDGKPLRVIGTHTDITERKELINELIEAKEKAEQMSRLKSSFLANMSHELRTPLVGIIGYSELLKESIQDPELVQMSENIFANGKRLSETLNLILDISKLEAEKMEFNLENLNLINEIEEVINLYKESARRKNLYIKSDYKIKSLYIKYDKRTLHSILTNLINNAIKYTHKGGVTIDVTSQENAALIKIIDTGIGISKADQEIIFEEFRQASEGLNRSYEGTGLGLHITKKLVQKFKGDVFVESEIGKGSIFTVKLQIMN